MGDIGIDEASDLALAISTAKRFLGAAFDGEAIENIGLEEVRLPVQDNIWEVTLGFNRVPAPKKALPGTGQGAAGSFLQAAALASARPVRVYKVVTIDLAGPRGLSITNPKDEQPAVPRLVLDANMLLVFVMGSVDPNLLGTAKRVKEYLPEDHGIITAYAGCFSDVVLLPGIASETSNLLDQVKGERRRLCMALLADLILASGETYVRSGSAVVQPEYMALGVTDASILCVLNEDTYLLTADFPLYMAAGLRGQAAEYFPYLRS